MIFASEVKEGSALHIDGKLFKVLEVVRHSGSGQMHGFIELKLKDLRFGHFADRRFKHTDKLEDVEFIKRQMEYLYSDTETHYFMDPETFNQVGVPKAAAEMNDRFFQEGTKVTVELLNDEAISLIFPKIIEIKIASTGPGRHEGQDNTMKSAILENGMEVLVPQFIVSGDLVRIDTEKIKYIDRVPVKKI